MIVYYKRLVPTWQGCAVQFYANFISCLPPKTRDISKDSLVKKGYVERSRGLEDRRVVYISLSERGRKAYGHHARFHREMIESLTSDLSEDEMQTLVKALMKLNQWFRSKDGQR